MTDRSQLVQVEDDPRSLGDRLRAIWRDGRAAHVGPIGPDLRPTLIGALSARGVLPAGTALVISTSGSTGPPRAVMLSHAALAASTAASLAALRCSPGERWALALPVKHIAGLQVLARAVALRTLPYVLGEPGDPEAIAAASHHAEHIALVPTQLVRCLAAGVDLRGFRSVLVGGAQLDPAREAEARAAGIALVMSYGMTETCGGCVYDGHPLPGVDVAVEDAGRIRLRGPMLATGYLGAMPEDEARFTADGWFITEDLGRLVTRESRSQTLEIIARVDAVINSGGVKIVPALVEDALRGLAGIVDLIVVGVDDPEWGERVRAVVVPASPSKAPTLEMIRAAVTQHLPATHAPRELVLVDEIRRDALGKLSAAERARLATYNPA